MTARVLWAGSPRLRLTAVLIAAVAALLALVLAYAGTNHPPVSPTTPTDITPARTPR